MTEIWVALIGAASGIAAVILQRGKRRAEKRAEQAEIRVRQAVNELSFQRRSLDFVAYMQDWSETIRAIKQLFAETRFDRFLLLRAWNGASDPKWVTAALQIRDGDQRVVSYIHVEIDAHYVDMLRDVKRHGYVRLHVPDMPDCVLRGFYVGEGVQCSTVHNIVEEPLEDGSVGHTFCSFGSRTPGEVTDCEIAQVRLIVGRLKGMALAFGGPHGSLDRAS